MTYQEKYKAHTRVIRSDRLPTLNHLNDGFTVECAEIRSAGICSLDGKKMEFQDIRIYVDTEEK